VLILTYTNTQTNTQTNIANAVEHDDASSTTLKKRGRLASEDGILYLYVVLATNLGLSICNKIPELKRYALWFSV